MDKRGQMFILAAVILSAVIVSLVSVKNYARVNEAPIGFYDLSSEIKMESARVIDYGIYNNENFQTRLQNFSGKIKENLYDSVPDTEFIFIYGNGSNFVVENYGKNIASVEGDSVLDCGTESKSSVNLYFGGSSVSLDNFMKKEDYGFSCKREYSWGVGSIKLVTLNINSKNYTFDLNEGQQFVVLMKKDRGNETYIDVQ